MCIRDSPYTIGSTVNGTGNKTPEDPSVKGYTVRGWSTDPKADPNKFERFTADTPLKDDTVAYAVWKINSYDVSIVKNGRGTISGTGAYDYGSSAKVTWQPEEGLYTNYVMVDGVIRDDLLNKNEYTFEGIEEDHTVYVAVSYTHLGETAMPYIENADKEILERAYAKAKRLYGDPLPEVIEKRLDKEMGNICLLYTSRCV